MDLTSLILNGAWVLVCLGLLGYGLWNRHQRVEGERKFKAQTEAALQKVNHQYNTLVTKIPVGVYILRSRQGHSVGFDYVSPRMSQLVGVPAEKILADGSCVFDVVEPQDRERLERINADRIPQQLPFEWEGQFLLPTGVRWMRISSLPDPQEDGDVLWHGLMVDITETKEAQDKVSALLSEKEVILKEVHHRIKNNMSTVSGLLSLQAATLQEPGVVNALEDAKGRVLSMMVLYDKLYLSGGHQAVDLSTYLPGLVDQVLGQFPNLISVGWETRAEAVVVDANVASSLGILVNELLTNTMKYAFVGRHRGMVWVTARQQDLRISVVVQDDGVGLPPGFDLTHSTGFGFTLVTMMTKQLKGTLSVSTDGGARFALEFPTDTLAPTMFSREIPRTV